MSNFPSIFRTGLNYILFSRSFVLSVLLSLITLPVVIHFAGIQAWTSVVAGQGLGLILAEFVDGGWTRIAPRINFKFGNELTSFYLDSLFEKSLRFLVAGITGTSILYFSHNEFFLYAVLSFVGWLMNGLSPLWLTIGTSNSKFTFRYWAIPRILSVIVGTLFLYLDFYFWTFLVIQILANVFSITILALITNNSGSEFEFSEFLDRKERLKFIVGGTIAAASNWFLVFFLSLSDDSSANSLVAVFRFAEFVYALSYIFPQSQHGSLATSKSTIVRATSHRIAYSLTLMVVISSFFSFSYINEVLFHGNVVISSFQLICVLSTIPIRIFFQLLVQDNLILQKKNSLVLLFNLISLIVSMLAFLLVFVFFDDIETLPLFYTILSGISLIIFFLFLNDVKEQVKETFKFKTS